MHTPHQAVKLFTVLGLAGRGHILGVNSLVGPAAGRSLTLQSPGPALQSVQGLAPKSQAPAWILQSHSASAWLQGPVSSWSLVKCYREGQSLTQGHPLPW